VQVSVAKRQQAIQAQNQRNSLYTTALQKRASQSSAGGPSGGSGYSGSLADVDLGNVSGSASRQKALQYASSLVGKTPYVWGGSSVKGTDCAGLVMMTYKQLGINIDTDRQIKNIPGVRTSISNLRPGDLVAWKDGSHIAIYAGNGKIIEAAHPGTDVRVHNIWSNAVYGIALRLPGE
jgi:cell wall-associated NlpC family hydrolase